MQHQAKEFVKKARMAHLFLQQLRETLKCLLSFAEVNGALPDPSAEWFSEIGTSCIETKAVCCLFSTSIHDKMLL